MDQQHSSTNFKTVKCKFYDNGITPPLSVLRKDMSLWSQMHFRSWWWRIERSPSPYDASSWLSSYVLGLRSLYGSDVLDLWPHVWVVCWRRHASHDGYELTDDVWRWNDARLLANANGHLTRLVLSNDGYSSIIPSVVEIDFYYSGDWLGREHCVEGNQLWHFHLWEFCGGERSNPEGWRVNQCKD